MEVKINREIRNYTESMFFGLSLRQFIFAILACGVAVLMYFSLRSYLGIETLSWMCIGFPIEFVNVRDDGTLICPGVTQHMSGVIHGRGSLHGSKKGSGKSEPAIYEGFNVHSLRHTFASNLRGTGVPEHIIQELLGHKSLETTQTYMHITSEQFNSAAKMMHSDSTCVDNIITEIAQKNFSEAELTEIINRVNSMLKKGA